MQQIISRNFFSAVSAKALLLALLSLAICCISLSTDADKCAHKHDIRFRQNLPIENVKLRDALKRYEKLHADCYHLFNQNFINDFKTEYANISDAKCKYTYLNIDSSGFGNRWMSITGFFLFSLLSDRVLLLHSKEIDVNELLCQPFPNSNWIIPMDFDFGEFRTKKGQLPGKIGGLSHHTAMSLLYEADYFTDITGHIQYLYEIEQYMIPLIFANTRYRKQLLDWFPDKNVASVLTRYLLHPRDHLWHAIVDSFTANRSFADVTVGIQFRQGFVVPDASSCFPELPDAGVHMYAASMSNVYGEATSAFPQWVVHQQYHSDYGEQHTTSQFATVVHDIFTLSMTDVTVIGRASTLGYVVMALKNEPLPLLNLGQGPALPGHDAGYCFTPTTHEPCCHLCHSIIPDYDDGVKWDDLFTECVDHPTGVKLSLFYHPPVNSSHKTAR